jgi:ferredoxin-NADP reductase
LANHFPLRLVDSRMLADSVRHLVFARADGENLPYIPGQFLQVHFEHAGAATKRSYSLANAPGASDHLEIAVSYVTGGAATQLFEHLQHGSEIQASGPYGRFCLMDSDKNQRYLLIGTGTGITPYRAMLPALAHLMQQRAIEVHVLQGARTSGELLYRDEFLAFAEQHPSFQYFGCTSREQSSGASWHVHGHVQAALAQQTADPERDIAYLCGNPLMVDECFNLLKAQNFPIPSVRREKYISSK